MERSIAGRPLVPDAYTFSKSLTRSANASVGGNYGWEKALTGFDVPHNFDFCVRL